MEIEDREIAQSLQKPLEEVLEIKEKEPATYEILKFGLICQKLSLTEEDLVKYHKQLEKEEER